MAKQIINIGQAANDRSGDPLRTAFEKTNANFTELYSAIQADIQIPVQTNNGGKYLTTNGTTLSWATVAGGGSANLGNWTFDADSATVSGTTLQVGKNSSETITQEDPGGVISQTTTNTSQVAIDATSTVITRSVNQVVNDGVTIATQENGAEIVVGNDGTWMKNYAEPEGPNNTIYFKVGTDNGAYLEGKQEDVGGYTFSQVKVANGNVLITTHSTDDKIWTFLPTGTLELPDGANIVHGDVKLSLNIDEGTAAYLGTTTDDSTALFMTTTGAQLYSSQSIGIATGIGLGTLEETYTGLEIEWGIQRDYDASVIAPATRPWAGMVSYDAYPLIMSYEPPMGVLPVPPNLAPTAKSASDSYTAWQEALAPVDGVSIASGSGTWTFEPTGILKLNNNSAEIYADPYYGSVRISSAPLNTAPSSHFTLGGTDNIAKIEGGPPGVAWTFGGSGILTLPSSNYLETTDVNLKVGSQGTVTIRSNAADSGTTKSWTFGTDGMLTLPAGGDIKNSTGTSVLGKLSLQAKPTTKEGQPGDKKGMTAIDSIGGDFYYCINDYTDGLSAIWAKVTGSTSWI